MREAGAHAAASGSPTPSDLESVARLARSRLELPDAASELLAVVQYLTATDGPLQAVADASRPSPWHEPVLAKALERLELIDGYLRGRVAFIVAGKDRGYDSFARELGLAEAALDNCRADTAIVEALLAGRLPSELEFDWMGHSALVIYPALEAFQSHGG